MWKFYGNKKTPEIRSMRERILYIALIMVGLFIISNAVQSFFIIESEESAARSEYNQIRDLYSVMSVYSSPDAALAQADSPDSQAPSLEFPLFRRRNRNLPETEQPDPIAALLEINSDYIGWLAIAGVLDYPVVQGYNNDVYMNRTFTGNYNSAGTVFMDSRNWQGFDAPVCIIYGHNMRDGSMFAQLNKYGDPAFINEHPYITVVTLEGEMLVYRIFAAGLTDIWNRAYALGFADGAAAARAIWRAPADADRFLLLSTCTNTEDDDERMLVYAALVN